MKNAKRSAKVSASKPSLTGRFDSQETATPAKVEYPFKSGEHKEYPEIEKWTDSFTITVKDDTEDTPKVIYKNDNEPFEYYKVPSLVSALRLNGAKLTDDQITFIGEALNAEETGKAVSALIDVINADLRASAKNAAYQRVFNQHKPLTEENRDNATASIVRNFMKLNNVSDETAIATLGQFGVIPKEYTIADFRENRGKR